MSDAETSQFPKMGESIIGSVVNISGQRSPYTKVQPRDAGGARDGQVPGVGTKKNKKGTLIHNAHGPKPKIVATIVYPNSPEASKNLRNTKRVQGPYSFALARAQAANSKGV